jgi:5-methylthioadenosine/S-adenosylhomocysteine deaminase
VVKRDPQALARRPRARAIAGRVRAAPAEPIALRGTVLTPDGASSGYVVVGGGTQIADVVTRKPQGVRVHDTNDAVICPGLIDLHGHPEFNVFAAWEPPRHYINRYQWRGREPLYDALIKQPIKRLRSALEPKTLLRYAEIRALVAGVTAIQGTGGTIQPHEEESLVRNVDRIIFDDQVGTSMLDLPSKTGRDREDLDDILADITAGHVKAFYLHLAEGQPDNKASTAEFDRMVDLHALTAATVIIHGTALTEDQLADLGLKLALGADWLPTGSTNLLAEMKVARQWLVVPAWGKRMLLDTSYAIRPVGTPRTLAQLRAGLIAQYPQVGPIFARRIVT